MWGADPGNSSSGCACAWHSYGVQMYMNEKEHEF